MEKGAHRWPHPHLPDSSRPAHDPAEPRSQAPSHSHEGAAGPLPPPRDHARPEPPPDAFAEFRTRTDQRP